MTPDTHPEVPPGAHSPTGCTPSPPPVLFSFQGKPAKTPQHTPPELDPGFPHLIGVAHNIRKGDATARVFSHLADDADFIFLNEQSRELSLTFAWASGPSQARFFHNCSGGANGVSLILGPRLAPFAFPLAALDPHRLLVACNVSLPLSPPFVLVSGYCPPPSGWTTEVSLPLRWTT